LTRRSDSTTSSVKSGVDGFFEIALEPGSYRICRTLACTVVDVVAGARTRADFDAFAGWSRCDIPGRTAMKCEE
jgi:hypothetical protein